jgi:hypothetical protein
MAALGSWGVRYQAADPTFAARSILLEEGGPGMWDAFRAELRHLHLGAPKPARSVLAELNAAYQRAVELRA